MKLSPKLKKSIDDSVLCWLASVSEDLEPNVSPKEIFTHYNDECIIIANIASPQSSKNIEINKKVCVSFVEILVQKGFQVKGKATILRNADPGYSEMEAELVKLTEGKFPFSTIFNIKVEAVKKIIAPRYMFFPETTEEEQIESARITYGL